MLNETIIGISQALDQLFEHDIHIGSIKQGLIEPCFLIMLLKGSHAQLIGNLYLRQQPFDILYYPQNKDDVTTETASVISLMEMELEYIMVADAIVRGTKMEHEVVDDVLHFFVNYDLRIRKELVPDEYMQTLIQKEEVKM